MIKRLMFLLLLPCILCANESDDLSAYNQQATALAASYQTEVQDLSRQSLQQSTAYDEEAQSIAAQNKVIPQPSASGVMVFVSLGMPALVLRQILMQANALGIPVIVRGILNNDFKQSAKALYAVLHPDDAPAIHGGVSIDPQWFKTFGITQVPALVAIGNAPPCTGKGCPPPPFDVVYGNIPIPKALQLIATQGDSAEGVAAQYLQKWEASHAD